MHKYVTFIVLLLVVVIVIIALLGWKPNWQPPISRYPTNSKLRLETENLVSQTVPTSIFEIYSLMKEAFPNYSLQIGYKFKAGKLSWEFYISTQNLNFEAWLQGYRHVFPDGHDFTMPPLKHNQDIFCISIDVTEDTFALGYVEQLNVYLNLYGKPKYEYTLKPDGAFEFRGEAVYQIPAQGKDDYNKVARLAVQEGFNAQKAVALMQWVYELGWSGSSYGFLEKGNQVGLYIFKPDTQTVKSYFETLHPNLTGIKGDMLKTIQEIAVYFENFPENKLILRDAFYVGF
jgi:hypothetical protein